MTPPDAIVLSYLAAQSLIDIRTRRISLLFTCVTAGAGVLHMILNRTGEMPECFLALLPGALLLLLGFAAGERVGKGDGLILLTCGLFLTSSAAWETLLFGLLFSSAFAVFLLIVKKRKSNASFPFVPFLCTGFLAAFFLPLMQGIL